MKRPPVPTDTPPASWRDVRNAEGAAPVADQRIAALLRRIPPPTPLSHDRFAAIARRLQGAGALSPQPSAIGHGRLRGAIRRRWAIVLAIVMGAGGLVFAQQMSRRLRQPPARAAASALPAPAAAAPEATWPRPTSALEPAAATAPESAAASPLARAIPSAASSRAAQAFSRAERGSARKRTLAARGSATAPARAAAPRSAEGSSAPSPDTTGPTEAPLARSSAANQTALLPEPDHTRLPLLSSPGEGRAATPQAGRLGEESTLLRQALQSLRHDDDPRGALDALDEYDQRFPFGALRPNAALVRVDATLALGRRGEARRLLDELDLRENPRRDELEVTRAELHSPDDCRAAIAGFAAVLGRDPSAGIAERALRGRARCHLVMGQTELARADLARYLERFPNGPLASEARQRLGR
jgi:TolA-binding protein